MTKRVTNCGSSFAKSDRRHSLGGDSTLFDSPGVIMRGISFLRGTKHVRSTWPSAVLLYPFPSLLSYSDFRLGRSFGNSVHPRLPDSLEKALIGGRMERRPPVTMTILPEEKNPPGPHSLVGRDRRDEKRRQAIRPIPLAVPYAITLLPPWTRSPKS